MNNIIKFFAAIFMFGVFQLSAQSAGKNGFAYLKTPSDTRAAALGGARVMLANDASSVFLNPAGLSLASQKSFIIAHHSFLEDFSQESAVYHFFSGANNIAAGINVINYPGIEIRSGATEKADGVVNAIHFDASLSYARSINGWHTGVTLKYLYEKYYLSSASGFAFDLGLIRRWNNYKFGVVVQNIGGMNKLDKTATPLPLIGSLGLAYTINYEILARKPFIAAEAQFVKDETVYYHLGIDLPLKQYLNIKCGMVAGDEALKFSAGLSINIGDYHIDYAYSPSPYQLGDSHRFALRFDI
jgi:hypothetical protein